MSLDAFIQRQFNSSGANLAYVAGPVSGPPVVLLHGVTSRWQPFQAIMPALAERYQVFALDLRGHGCSSHTPGAYRLTDYSEDVSRFILQIVGTPSVIYGHSLGALVAIHLAALQPKMVRALLLGDPPLYYHDTRTRDTFWHAAFTELLEFMQAYPEPAEMEIRLAQIAPGMSPERRAERLRSLEGLDPDVVRNVIADELMEGVALAALAPQIICPVLLLRGDQKLGSALREQDVEFARTHFTNIRLLEMQTVGHGIIPAALLPEMMAFIDAALSVSGV